MLSTHLPTAIRDACNDVETILKDPNYVFDVYQWHEPGSKCHVCIAGASIAMRLDSSREVSLDPCNFDNVTASTLRDINAVRVGSGCELSDGTILPNWTNLNTYDHAIPQILEEMRKRADWLEENA